MKTDSTKLFEEMLKDNSTGQLSESQKIEDQINETIKASMEKMQTAFEKKLQETEDKVTNIIKEKEIENNDKEESEEGNRNSGDISEGVSTEEEGR